MAEQWVFQRAEKSAVDWVGRWAAPTDAKWADSMAARWGGCLAVQTGLWWADLKAAKTAESSVGKKADH